MNPGPLAFDTETTGLNTYSGDRVTMASFADETGAWAARPDDAGRQLREAVSQGRTIVMHNEMFDRAVAKVNWGIDIPDDQIEDTMALDWMVDENRDHRLKEGLGARVFGLSAKAEKDALKAYCRGVPQAEMYKFLRDTQTANGVTRGKDGYVDAAGTRALAKDLSEGTKKTWKDLGYDDDIFREYAIKDADLTYRLYLDLENEIKDLPHVQKYRDQARRVASLTYRINDVGIRVSEEALFRGHRNADDRATGISRDLGLDDVNLKSPAQMAKLLFEDWGLPVQGMTESGNPSTDKDVLNNLSYDPRVAQLLEYRQATKQVDGYFRPLIESIGSDGRIHPTLHPWRTVTGRWSASRPNLQTIPKRGEHAGDIRCVFIPEDGMALTELDLSQIEVRIGADMSKEPALLAVYEEGGDVYQALADDIGVSRSVAKTVILSAQYGVGPKKLSQTLALGTGKKPDWGQARRILDAYWANYPNLERLMNGLQEVAKRRGYVPLWKPGRRRTFRSPWNPHPRWYSALNAAIQGGAAELMKDVMLAAEPHINEYGRIVLTVHDSILIEHEPGCEKQLHNILETITKDVSPYSIETPWEAEPWK